MYIGLLSCSYEAVALLCTLFSFPFLFAPSWCGAGFFCPRFIGCTYDTIPDICCYISIVCLHVIRDGIPQLVSTVTSRIGTAVHVEYFLLVVFFQADALFSLFLLPWARLQENELM